MDRTSLVFVIRTNREVGHVVDYAFKKIKIINNIDAVNKEEEKYYDFLRKYILYVKRFEPELSKEAEVMIVQYFANIMRDPQSHESLRLFDTLTSLCFAVARLRQKDIIDAEDVKEVTEFYNVQLQQLSQVAIIPRNPLDLVLEKVIEELKGKPFEYELVELVEAAKKRVYIGDYLRVDHNRRFNEVC